MELGGHNSWHPSWINFANITESDHAHTTVLLGTPVHLMKKILMYLFKIPKINKAGLTHI